MNKTFDCSETFGDYLRLTVKMMNNFKFKLVDEDQLMKIVKQVKREKRRIRDDDEKRTFLLEKEKRSSPTVNVDKVLAGENEIPTINSDRLDCQDCNCHSMNSVNKCHQNDNNIIKDNNNRALPSTVVCKEQVRSICDQIGVQRCSTVSLNRPENKKMVVFIKNIQVLRERLISYLDAFLQQHEQSAYEKVSKNNSRCKERHQRKIKAYQYHILKLDYQLVLDMKNLNHCIMRHDVLGLLKVLSKCHSSALQMFQVFLRGLPEILEKEREKNKFRELLKCMVTLSNFCKFIRNNITEIKPSRDLLMDDLNKRCKSILYAMEKIQVSHDCLHKQMKKRREWNIHNDLFKSVQDTENKNSIQLLSTNKIQISRNSFRKLVKKVFGAEGQKSSCSKVNNAAECEDNNFSGVSKLPKERYKEGIRKSKDLIYNEDKNSDMPSNIKLILESDVDAGFKCISVGTQYSSSLENNVENIDAESFSNNLFIAFEKKLDNYFQNLFQHLSNDQGQRIDTEKELPIEELLELKNSASGNTFNNADNTSLPEELFQSRYKNETESSLKQHEAFELDKGVTEAGEVFMKLSKQNGTLSNEENGKLRKSPSNTVNKQLTSSCGSPSSEKSQRILPNKRNMASYDNVPCEMIGSISDRLIEECLNSFSYEIDTLITQMVIDLELT